MASKRLTITLPEEVKKKLERIAKNQKRTQSNVIRLLIEEYEEGEE